MRVTRQTFSRSGRPEREHGPRACCAAAPAPAGCAAAAAAPRCSSWLGRVGRSWIQRAWGAGAAAGRGVRLLASPGATLVAQRVRRRAVKVVPNQSNHKRQPAQPQEAQTGSKRVGRPPCKHHAAQALRAGPLRPGRKAMGRLKMLGGPGASVGGPRRWPPWSKADAKSRAVVHTRAHSPLPPPPSASVWFMLHQPLPSIGWDCTPRREAQNWGGTQNWGVAFASSSHTASAPRGRGGQGRISLAPHCCHQLLTGVWYTTGGEGYRLAVHEDVICWGNLDAVCACEKGAARPGGPGCCAATTAG